MEFKGRWGRTAPNGFKEAVEAREGMGRGVGGGGGGTHVKGLAFCVNKPFESKSDKD